MGSTGVFDKIEKEALKLYDRTVKIRTKRMAADGSQTRTPKGGFHRSNPMACDKRGIIVPIPIFQLASLPIGFKVARSRFCSFNQ